MKNILLFSEIKDGLKLKSSVFIRDIIKVIIVIVKFVLCSNSAEQSDPKAFAGKVSLHHGYIAICYPSNHHLSVIDYDNNAILSNNVMCCDELPIAILFRNISLS